MTLEPSCQIPIECKGDTADVLIYDQIGKSFFDEGLTAKAFAEALKGHGSKIKTINVRINSPGGSVFDGTAIYNTLRNHGAKVVTHIEGGALSIASLIAMAGDERRMAKNSYLMIHDPMSVARGRAEDMRRAADMLDKVKATLVETYAQRSGHDAADIAEMMGKETWINAKDAKELGFVDTVTDDSTTVAVFDPQAFSNVPLELLNTSNKELPPMSEPKPATLQELKALCVGAGSEFLLAQLEVSATPEAASKAWMAELVKQRDAATAEATAAKETAKAVAATGVDPLPTGKPAASNEGDYDSLVAEKVSGGMKKPAAIKAVMKEHPEAYKAMLAKANRK